MKLELGYSHPFEIRTETYEADCHASFSVLYLSDLHFTRFSGKMVERIIEAIAQLQPTIILLGGDYADSKDGLIHLNNLLRQISSRNNVFAISGNHDYRWRVDGIRNFMVNNDIVWLEKRSFIFAVNGTKIRIDGNCIPDTHVDSDFSILALHKPLHTDQFAGKYNLALAGHLHGSQFVFWRTAAGLFPGRLFYRWNILKAQEGNCLYVISKGLGDTLPIRYNCKRDMLLIKVNGNAKRATS